MKVDTKAVYFSRACRTAGLDHTRIEKLIDALKVQQYIDQGYRRVSRGSRIVARIDSPKWIERLANSQPNGLDWVVGLGRQSAEDHYRRCHSKDTMRVATETQFKMYPASADTVTGWKAKEL